MDLKPRPDLWEAALKKAIEEPRQAYPEQNFAEVPCRQYAHTLNHSEEAEKLGSKLQVWGKAMGDYFKAFREAVGIKPPVGKMSEAQIGEFPIFK